MKVLIDICHPAHVHFFKNIIALLQKNDHDVLITSRDKDVTIDLLNKINIHHICISKAPKKATLLNFFKELVIREFHLLKLVLKYKPDVMTGIGGTFISHIGFISRVKRIAFYDTENAKLQNLITYPFLSQLVVPNCYSSWTPKNTERYSGYHELSYLHGNYFTPRKELAVQNGLNPMKNNYLLRIVSWQANHDINERGWTNEFLARIISLLSSNGNIIISTERELPQEFKQFKYSGSSEMLHHVLAFCNLIIGESATLSSEAVVLGVPSIYVANTSRGYVDEQQNLYKMAKVIGDFNIASIEENIIKYINIDSKCITSRHSHMLNNTVDVCEYAYQTIISTD